MTSREVRHRGSVHKVVSHAAVYSLTAHNGVTQVDMSDGELSLLADTFDVWQEDELEPYTGLLDAIDAQVREMSH